jgi:malonate transporter and related proteins
MGMTIFLQAADIVAPVFIIVFIGYGLRKLGLIDDTFIQASSKLVFNVAMPVLIFSKIATMPIHELFDGRQVIFACIGVAGSFLLCWLISLRFTHNGRDRGAFIQGAFRSNFAILGFALLTNAYGKEALGSAAVLLAFIMILYNVLSVVALTVPQKKERRIPTRQILLQVITNPLLLAAFISLPISLLALPLPRIVENSAEQLAALTLPLALLGIGGSLSFKGLQKDWRLASLASLLRIAVLPLLLVGLAIHLGFRGERIGVLFFLFASPTAIASYPMADAMGSNSRLAGHIILLTTLGSIVTISMGIIWLKNLGVM